MRALRRFLAVPGSALLILAAVMITGSELGRLIAFDQRSESRAEREIIIGSDRFLVPENIIRFAEARRDGVHRRLDLYLSWPDLDGYTRKNGDVFNHVDGRKLIVFLTLEPPLLVPDMSGRLDPIYRQLVSRSAVNGPAGLLLYRFKESSGYAGEILVVGERPGGRPFVARCLSGELGARWLAPCTRDTRLTDGVSITYRFPEELLGEWHALEEAVLSKAKALLQTTR